MQNEPMVHIVDDDDAVREALTLLLQSEDIPVQAYISAEDFLDQHVHFKLGCMLLDMRMPGMNGLQLLKLLKERGASIPVIFITGHGDIAMAVQAMKAGATDFIEKPFDNDHLLSILRKCLADCIGINNANELRHEMEARLAHLTNRERQVMEMLVDGKHNKDIAMELDISPRTVEIHRANVMKKIHARSLSDIVRTTLLVTKQI